MPSATWRRPTPAARPRPDVAQQSLSPFETKDKLKTRGYRWSADLRCWSRVVSGTRDYEDELAWLKHHVYADRNARIEVEQLGGRVRYSAREGHKEAVTL